jgi:hypothetical protein
VTKRGKCLVAGAGAALLAAWSATQLVLTHRYWTMFADWRTAKDQLFAQSHPQFPMQPFVVHTRYWVEPALACVVSALACTAIAALLVRGGRRWWALLIAVLPAANALWGWQDDQTFGAGWTQWPGSGLVAESRHWTAWLVTGVVVDTLVLVAIATALVFVVPVRQTKGAGLPWRVLPALVVLGGWWLMRNPLPDRVHEIWLVEATAYVLAVGLLVTCTSHWLSRAVGIFVVLPFCALATSTGAVTSTSFPGLLHHDAFALATVAWMLAAAQLQARNSEGSARSAATSAMNWEPS